MNCDNQQVQCSARIINCNVVCVCQKMSPYLLLIGLSFLGLSSGETGSCPPTLPVDICGADCGPDQPCSGKQLCCPTACGGSMCVDAMTKRMFVDYVKPGQCPEFPRGPWVCSSTCSGDTDCPRKLKCCENRCGARVCQKPEYLETNDENAV